MGRAGCVWRTTAIAVAAINADDVCDCGAGEWRGAATFVEYIANELRGTTAGDNVTGVVNGEASLAEEKAAARRRTPQAWRSDRGEADRVSLGCGRLSACCASGRCICNCYGWRTEVRHYKFNCDFACVISAGHGMPCLPLNGLAELISAAPPRAAATTSTSKSRRDAGGTRVSAGNLGALVFPVVAIG